jgi:hypothetical protein
MDWTRSQFGSQGLVVIAVLLFVVLAFVTRDWATRLSRRRRWSRARFAESAAPSLLAQFGYEVLGAQVPGQYTLSVDGQAVSVPLRVDFIVARDGRQYIAEVKSGRSAPLLSTSATRRQLLEYLVAFPVDGVLLVDAENRRIHEVRFPTPWSTPRQRTGAWAIAVAILVLIAAVALYWVRS